MVNKSADRVATTTTCSNSLQGTISMSIYPSTKVAPYVYMGSHKITKQIYIGYREANIKLSHIDLFEYRTSSKIVNPTFDEYDWIIIAEFNTGNDAYDHEQQMIFENWDNPLLVNEYCHYHRRRFKRKDRKLSQSTKEKISISNSGKKRTEEFKRQMSIRQTGKSHSVESIDKMKSRTVSTETRKAISIANKGKILSDTTIDKIKIARNRQSPLSAEARQKISEAHTGKTMSLAAKQKISMFQQNLVRLDVTCPHCGKTGKGNAMKQWHFDRCKSKLR